MRGRIATVLAALLFLTIIYLCTPKSAYPLHIPGGYPYVKPKTPAIYAPTPNPPSTTPPPKKVIVKVQLPGEDLSWLLKLLPEWRNQVITLDLKFARLHDGAQRVDSGRIADAYLSWIVTNYANLAETMVFVAPALAQQEADAMKWRLPNQELISAIQHVRIEEVRKQGFAPLSCAAGTACQEAISPLREPPDEFRTLEVRMAKAWEGLFNNTLVPAELASPGGSEFVVAKEQVLKRSVEEYTRYWEWLARTKMDDDSAGALVQRLWHVIFGRASVWCPGAKECECGVFGRC
ncbi:uncharacterized protein EKO05_0007255 [Ascochyta rabiei]|uniref:Uncharacterized protein n=1 Tax=Didymella rabiei TaxID=5454 RepID=A0A163H1U1_DIDRA|nr:uncharacterized protein EKO05_0007255 [Ascochyta rabiei]KZM25116.1 hypothetical protein ST47_g3739 [Ascochyta rabiei]UPX16872.1 hypothetical protein EKO05_0007255 [Ascochyta rabiei]